MLYQSNLLFQTETEATLIILIQDLFTYSLLVILLSMIIMSTLKCKCSNKEQRKKYELSRVIGIGIIVCILSLFTMVGMITYNIPKGVTVTEYLISIWTIISYDYFVIFTYEPIYATIYKFIGAVALFYLYYFIANFVFKNFKLERNK